MGFRKINDKQMKHLIIFISIIIVALLACEGDLDGESNYYSSDSGTGGSLARFTIAEDYLYTVDNQSLNVYSVKVPDNPVYQNNIFIDRNIETIFNRDSLLFIGSQFGMYIYDITTPTNPERLSDVWHVYSCDPVIADDKYAYVTLSSSNTCGRWTNELQIIDIKDPKNPQQVMTYSMTEPKGLSKKDSLLFLCDDGLKVYNVKNVMDIELLYYFKNIPANDVIALDSLVFVIANDGFHQYLYKDGTMELLSSLKTPSK